MIWLILKALFTIIPVILQMIQEGRIREGTMAEFEAGMAANWEKRLAAAKAAGEGELPNEDNDPNNRARPRFDGLHDGDGKPPLSVG